LLEELVSFGRRVDPDSPLDVPDDRVAVDESQPLEMAFVAAHPEKAVFEAAALQVGLEFPVDRVWEGFALLGQLVHKGGEVRFNEAVE
jgi:hypothetical protein